MHNQSEFGYYSIRLNVETLSGPDGIFREMEFRPVRYCIPRNLFLISFFLIGKARINPEEYMVEARGAGKLQACESCTRMPNCITLTIVTTFVQYGKCYFDNSQGRVRRILTAYLLR